MPASIGKTKSDPHQVVEHLQAPVEPVEHGADLSDGSTLQQACARGLLHSKLWQKQHVGS